ncbi:MAG: pilus assembly protein PilM [bacterium]|nr:pilus assembly protein PilM [bacterium]
MFENIAAIDIGTSSLKIVTVKTGLKDFQLKSFLYEDMDFHIKDEDDEIKDAIHRLLEEEDIHNHKIIVNFPMEKTIIRNITFPFTDVEKIAAAIPFEAEEDMPFSLDEISLDFQSMKSEKKEEGKVLLAAAYKDTMQHHLKDLAEYKITPIFMGLEANALFECYRYFNVINEEAIVQIHMGHTKSIINIIVDNNLLYTRSIPDGGRFMYKAISEALKVDYSDAGEIFHKLDLDLTSFENNVHKGIYKELNLTKQKFQKIYNEIHAVADILVEQISITVRSFQMDNDGVEFNRVMISGGLANLKGIGTQVSKALSCPVVALPFLDDYKEEQIRTQFPIAFGLILSYLYNRKSSINFLKGEFTPDAAQSTKKIYYLAAAFLSVTVFVLLFNLVAASIMTSNANDEYDALIKKRFEKNFRKKNFQGNPIKEARKILKKEKTKMDKMSIIFSERRSVMDLFKSMLQHFPSEADFKLKNLVINESSIRIDGTIGSSKHADKFKEALLKSNEFDSVSLNIQQSQRDGIRFSMTIRQKLLAKKTKAGKTRQPKKSMTTPPTRGK